MLSRMTSSNGCDALEFLKQDHAAIAELVDRYDLDTDGKEPEAFLSAATVVGPATTPALASRGPKRPGETLAPCRDNGGHARRIRSISRLG